MINIDDEFKNLIPALALEEYQELEESLLTEGCRDAIVLWDNTIIDGHNRYAICEEHEIEYETISKEFASRNEAIHWIIKNQFGRRNITEYTRSVLALRLEEVVAAMAKERQLQNLKKGNSPVVENLPPREEAGKTRDILAKDAGTSGKSIDKVKKILKANLHEETLTALDKGELSIDAGYQIAKVSETEGVDVATKIAKQVLSGEAKSAKEAISKYKVNKKKEEYIAVVGGNKQNNNAIDIFNTKTKFRVIYADPPWQYNDKQETAELGGASKHYDTMAIDDICKLPVKNIIEKDAILFMWVTSPLLEECFAVINAWGFKYKSSFIWDKVGHSMGHYNSVRHELLLICTKGSCTPDNKKLYDSVVSIEKTDKHSEKPKEFLDIIDDLYQYGNKIELFARSNKKENWNIWGNEV